MFDLALGVIIGAAFSTVVDSLSNDIIGDFIAALGGVPDMSGLTVPFLKGQTFRQIFEHPHRFPYKGRCFICLGQSHHETQTRQFSCARKSRVSLL